MTLKDRIKALCKVKETSMNKVEIELGFGTGYISKLNESHPNSGKLQQIADRLDVSLDYLMGNRDYVICPVCGFLNNPLSEQSRKEHEEFHQKFLSIKDKYPFFMCYTEAEKQRTDSIHAFRSYQKSIEEKVAAFDKYLESAFSLEILRNNCELSGLDYDQFCRVEVSTLYSDDCISQEFIDALIEKYGIDRDFLAGNEQLFARINNNEQIIRILRYLEKLKPELLYIVEKQIKALSDTTDIDNSLSNNTIVPMPNRSSEIEVDAAHSIPDASEKDKKHDDDIMDDENF